MSDSNDDLLNASSQWAGRTFTEVSRNFQQGAQQAGGDSASAGATAEPGSSTQQQSAAEKASPVLQFLADNLGFDLTGLIAQIKAAIGDMLGGLNLSSVFGDVAGTGAPTQTAQNQPVVTPPVTDVTTPTGLS